MRSRLLLPLHKFKTAANEICLTAQQKKKVIKSLKIVVKEAYSQKKIHDRVPYPDLQRRLYVRRVVIGERWLDQGRQRRRITLTSPARERGMPKYLYAHYLMIKLGEIYVRFSGKSPTRGSTSGCFSRFERFASPFFDAFKIGDFRNRVRRYMDWRKSQGL